MKLITDLFEILDKHTQESSLTLTMKASDYASPAISNPHPRVADVATFLQTGLDLDVLPLTRQVAQGTPPPFVVLAGDENSLELVGLANDLFSTSEKEVRLTMRGIAGATEAEDTLEVILSATYDDDEKIEVVGISWLLPAQVTATLVMTSNAADGIVFDESRDGSVEIAGEDAIPLRMSKPAFDNTTWQVGLAESVEEEGLALNLNQLAFVLDLPTGTGSGSLSEFIPASLRDILFPAEDDTQLRIHRLFIEADEVTKTASQFEIDLRLASTAEEAADDPNAWELFEGLALRQIRLAFQIENPSANSAGRTVGFEVLGGIIIGDTSLPDFFTSGVYGDNNAPWQTGFVTTPSSEGTISLSTLLAMVGDDGLVNSIPELVLNMLEISLEHYVVTYNPYLKELHQFDVALAKAAPFRLVDELPEVSELLLTLVFSGLNTDTQATAATLNGQIHIDNGGTIALGLTRTDTGGWILEGNHQADDNPSSFEDLLAAFIPGDIYWPGPDIGITDGPNVPDNLEFVIYLNDQVVDEDGEEVSHFAGDLFLKFIDEAPVQLLSNLSIESLQLAIQRSQIELTPANNGTPAVRESQFDAFFAGAIRMDDEGDGILLQLSATLPSSREEDLILEGNVSTEQGLPIGQLVGSVLKQLNDDFIAPESLNGFVINTIAGEYRLLGAAGTTPRDKHIEFGVSGSLPLDNFSAFPSINFAADQTAGDQDGELAIEVDGLLVLDFSPPAEPNTKEFEFGLNFASSAGSKFLMANFHIPEGNEIFLDTVVGAIDSSLSGMPDIELPLRSLFIGYQSIPIPVAEQQADANGGIKTHQGNFLFGMALSTDMNFSKLPLVGSLLQEDETIGVDNMLAYYSTGNWSVADIGSLNDALPVDTQLPAADALQSGAHLFAEVGLGDTIQAFFVSMGSSSDTSSQNGTSTAPTTASATGSSNTAAKQTNKAPLPAPGPDDEGKWFNINKQLGPLYIARIGLYFIDQKLLFVLDSEMTLGPLTISLDDLSFGSRLDRFDPEFNLRGIGLQYKKPPIEVSGLFLRIKNESVQRPGLVIGDRFAGAATIKTSALTISAVGEYASVNNEPSFYLYAYLGYPLGGPAFFFVEGLAAGFGYNRSVRLPEMDQVTQHPMIAIVLNDDASPLELADALVNGDFIPIDPGSIFLAIGVRFSTFKLLDSFLMLAATFGDPFRIDMLGFSRLVLPPPVKGKTGVTPLAEVTLALKGTFIPSQGILGIQAQLTEDSYILSKDCTLQGGFAFYTWFAGSPHEGDFVITLGGYHPKFSKPAHYPTVPRLGFNWVLTKEISIKGRMYFALTPTAVMAGGKLEAVWKSGDLKAWFTIGADFIISWKPYFYDAHMYMNMGVSYTFWFFGEQTISFDIGVDLHIWGPEFAGVATVDLSVVSFTVEFGDTSVPALPPLTWSEFQESFIPEQSVSMSIINGLEKTTDEGTWIINPNLLTVQTDSVLPLHRIDMHDPEGDLGAQFPIVDGTVDVGLAPMDIRRNSTSDTAFETHLQLTLLTETDQDISNLFAFTTLTKAVPKAIWGRRFSASMNGDKLIEGALNGIRLDLLPPGDPDVMAWIDQSQQIFTISNKINDNDFEWVENTAFADQTAAPETVNDLLSAFGFTADRNEDLDLLDENGSLFRIDPGLDGWSGELSLSGEETMTTGSYS